MSAKPGTPVTGQQIGCSGAQEQLQNAQQSNNIQTGNISNMQTMNQQQMNLANPDMHRMQPQLRTDTNPGSQTHSNRNMINSEIQPCPNRNMTNPGKQSYPNMNMMNPWRQLRPNRNMANSGVQPCPNMNMANFVAQPRPNMSMAYPGRQPCPNMNVANHEVQRGPNVNMANSGIQCGPHTNMANPGVQHGPNMNMAKPGVYCGPNANMANPGVERGPCTNMANPGVQCDPNMNMRNPGVHCGPNANMANPVVPHGANMNMANPGGQFHRNVNIANYGAQPGPNVSTSSYGAQPCPNMKMANAGGQQHPNMNIAAYNVQPHQNAGMMKPGLLPCPNLNKVNPDVNNMMNVGMHTNTNISVMKPWTETHQNMYMMTPGMQANPDSNQLNRNSVSSGSHWPVATQSKRGLGKKNKSRKASHEKFSQLQGPDNTSSQQNFSKGQGNKSSKRRDETKGNDDNVEVDFYVGPYCEVCELHLNDEHMLWRHMSGKKHLKAMKAIQEGRHVRMRGNSVVDLAAKRALEKPVSKRLADPYSDFKVLTNMCTKKLWQTEWERHPENKLYKIQPRVDDPIPSHEPLPLKIQARKENLNSDNVEETSTFEKAFSGMTRDEPVIGLGFVVETCDDKEILFTCELCDIVCNSNNMVVHIIGLKHRMAYMKKCDPERYGRLKKTQKRSKLTEDARNLCKEVESVLGRGTPRYKGPKQQQSNIDTTRYQRRELSEAEKTQALESLKRTLMQDFVSCNNDFKTVKEMLEHRLELLKDYEKRGVPFDVAKEKVIEDEERWSMLLEFERQSLSFDEAEERIDCRMSLLKTHVGNGCSKEEAKKKVLDEEVIRDFRKEFQQLGMMREQAQKQVEKRLWMLEHLHYQGFSQEAASQKVMTVERELRQILQSTLETDVDRKHEASDSARWVEEGKKLEKFIANSYRELNVAQELTEAHIKLALDLFQKYKKRGLSCDKAKFKVVVNKLPIPQTNQEETTDDKVPDSSNSTGVQPDIAKRVVLFMSKLHAVIVIDKTGSAESEAQPSTDIDKEKQLTTFDQLSHLEIQSLLLDMVRTELHAEQAKLKFESLYEQLEYLRKSLFPFTAEEGEDKKDRSRLSDDERWNIVVDLFMQNFSLNNSAAKRKRHSCSPDSVYLSDDHHTHRSTISRSRSHGRQRRRSRSGSRSLSPYDYYKRKAGSGCLSPCRCKAGRRSRSWSRSLSPYNNHRRNVRRSRSGSRSVSPYDYHTRKRGRRSWSNDPH